MATSDIAAAMQRVGSVVRRRPEMAIDDDTQASACWSGGLRVVTRHPSGSQVVTDMPRELGGAGDQISPGWLLRAALASCALTRITMAAAEEGIELRALEAVAHSRSDVRGLLGVTAADGTRIWAGPGDVQLVVRIAAPGASADQLRALVQRSCRSSPVGCALEDAVPVALRVEVEAA